MYGLGISIWQQHLASSRVDRRLEKDAPQHLWASEYMTETWPSVYVAAELMLRNYLITIVLSFNVSCYIFQDLAEPLRRLVINAFARHHASLKVRLRTWALFVRSASTTILLIRFVLRQICTMPLSYIIGLRNLVRTSPVVEAPRHDAQRALFFSVLWDFSYTLIGHGRFDLLNL